MPYYDFDPSLDFDAQEQEMVQAAARIKALRAMKLDTDIEQPQGFTSAVTGAKFLAPTVKKPLLSSLTPLLQDTVAAQQEKELNQQRVKVNEGQQKFYEELLGSYPTSRVEPMAPGAPRLMDGVDPVSMQKSIDLMTDPTQKAEAQQALDNHKAGYQQLVQPSRKELLDWTAKTQRGGPLVKSLGAKKAEDILLNEDERQAKLSMERTKFNENVRQFGVEEARKRLADDNQARYWQGTLDKDKGTVRGSFDFMHNEPDPDRPGQQRSVHYNATTQQTSYGPEKKEKEPDAVVKDRIEAEKVYFRSHNVLKELPNAKELIEKSTGSSVGNWIDTKWSALGGTTAGAAAIKALEPLAGSLMMSVPRFEGPQSDDDRKTYAKASADIANADTPNAQRWAALQTMARLTYQAAAQHEDRYGMPKGSPGSVRDLYGGMFQVKPAPPRNEGGPLTKSNPKKPSGTTGDWNTPAAGGYKPPPAGSVDTSPLEAQYAAAKDDAERGAIASRILSLNPEWKPPGQWGIKRIK